MDKITELQGYERRKERTVVRYKKENDLEHSFFSL